MTDPVEFLRVLAMGNFAGFRVWQALDDPRTAADLREQLDLPHATAYRAINQLEGVGLITPASQTRSHAQRYIRVHKRVAFTPDAPHLELPERHLRHVRDGDE